MIHVVVVPFDGSHHVELGVSFYLRLSRGHLFGAFIHSLAVYLCIVLHKFDCLFVVRNFIGNLQALDLSLYPKVYLFILRRDSILCLLDGGFLILL